ncbi:MAG TPA: heterodisulfide reductase-related iron-sulfur binding cluster [Gemmataceae bacterium]|nr:heterodisulfide reductase-related iron-sulfur binding cluster [Gemmataceae bacterium]
MRWSVLAPFHMALDTEAVCTRPPDSAAAPSNGAGIDYELFLDCVHCGLCTSACPTYVELGQEADSPRGRIYLMRAVTDGRLDLNAEVRQHLDLCLDCRACESACPSGVQYGKLIEPFRIHMAKTAPQARSLGFFQRFLLYHITPYARRMRWALAPMRFLQWSRIDRLVDVLRLPRILPASLRQIHEMVPRLKWHYGRLPEVLPAEGKRRARVALFTGCASDAFFPQTNVATARVLQRNGCEVWIPRSQVCCGALHYHSALEEPAKQFASANCEVFGGNLSGVADQVDAIIVNAAGCGAMLKDYGHLLHDTPLEASAQAFARKVRDISEFLVDLGPVEPRHPLPLRAVYQDACHLCHAQQIRKQPRQLLEMIPGLELVPIAEAEICCGAAGSYNLTQPEMAERLGQRKVQNILDARVQAVFSGNVGCLLQVGRYLRRRDPNIWVTHFIDALWASYNGELPKLPMLKKDTREAP